MLNRKQPRLDSVECTGSYVLVVAGLQLRAQVFEGS